MNQIDKDLLSWIKSILSVFVTAFFGLYHLILGILNQTKFNQAISAFYFMLPFLRSLILFSGKKKEKQILFSRIELVFLLLLDLTLEIPVVLMLLGEREVSLGTIPAIASAAYTAFKTTSSLVSFFRKNGTETEISKHVRLHDSLLSILVLQNTLILTFGQKNQDDMKILATISSTIIVLFMLFDSLYLIHKQKKQDTGK